MTAELGLALAALVLLCASAAAGFAIRPWIPERHRSAESAELLRLIVGLLVTFAALVMGLLTTSAKQAFDTANHDRYQYAATLTLLDRCLRDYGAEADPVRTRLQDYVAGVIASTWPEEPLPPGLRRPDTTGMPRVGESQALGRMLDGVGLAIRRLPLTDGFHTALAADCTGLLQDAVKLRWTLIDEAAGTISGPFLRLLMVWLMIVFASFGLTARHNGLVMAAILLCAVSVASALFVILDLDTPYTGLFGITSAAMRDALAHMME